MMKTVIAYYSHGGNNKKLAVRLQKRMECSMLPIKEAKRRSWFARYLDLLLNRMPRIEFEHVALADYDFVVCIAPIWAGKVAPPFGAFLSSEKDQIKRYAFLTICGGAVGQKEKIGNQLRHLMGNDPECIIEMWISSLSNGSINTAKYKVDDQDLDLFQDKIEHFMKHYATMEKTVEQIVNGSG